MNQTSPPFTGGSLADRIAIVTGCNGNLGPPIIEALCSQGARVFGLDVHPFETDALRLIPHFTYRTVDISCENQLLDFDFFMTSNNYTPNILVNNAAINPQVKNGPGGVIEQSRLEYFDVDSWNLEVSVGLTGAILCAKIFGKKMASSGGGVILNMASDLSVIAPSQHLYRKEGVLENQQPVKPVGYSVVKTGLVGLTRYLASYWASEGVRCNALSPGGVFIDQPADFVQKIEALVPLGRMASMADVVGAVTFLCSDASSYITGQNIVVDGGRSIV